MADIIDKASDVETQQRELAVQQALRDNEPEQEFGEFDQVVCIECGCDIPVDRLVIKPNAARCVDCQTYIEGRKP